jgi:hypothetical protein
MSLRRVVPVRPGHCNRSALGFTGGPVTFDSTIEETFKFARNEIFNHECEMDGRKRWKRKLKKRSRA